MARKDKVVGQNARWSVDPQAEPTWHVKFDGTAEMYPKGSIVWIDVETYKTGKTVQKEVCVVDYLDQDYQTRQPVVFGKETRLMSDEEIEEIQTKAGTPRTKRRQRKKKTADGKPVDPRDIRAIRRTVEENNKMLRALMDHLDLKWQGEDGDDEEAKDGELYT